MADYRSDVPPDVARRLLNQALSGLWRVHPVYYDDVNPLSPDVDLIEGFDLVRGSRRVRVYLTDLTPEEAFRYRMALVSRLSDRVMRSLRPFLQRTPEGMITFRPDTRVTPVYVRGKPQQIVVSRPGVRPLRMSVRDFIGLLYALRNTDEVIMHGKTLIDGKPTDFWIIGNRSIMESIGRAIQQGYLPLDLFTRRGNVLFLNADRLTPDMLRRRGVFKPAKFVKRSVWGWSP